MGQPLFGTCGARLMVYNTLHKHLLRGGSSTKMVELRFVFSDFDSYFSFIYCANGWRGGRPRQAYR